jgi:MFS family permease
VVFFVSTAFGVVDIVMFAWVPHVPPRLASGTSPWATLVRPLRDRHFIWFCTYIAMLILAVAPMGQFATLYLVEELRVNSKQVQLMLLVAPMLGQFLVTPIWGRMADKIGRKPMLAISTLLLVPVGFGWCLMNFGHIGLGYLLAVAGAMLWVAVEIANFNLVLEMSGSDDTGTAGRGSGYTSVNSVILAIAGTVGGLGAGWLMTSLKHVEFTFGFTSLVRPFGNYEILFAISAAIRLLATVLFLPRLHEPQAGTTREAIEFMTDNLYDNLRGVMMEPVKRFLIRERR